MKVTFIEDDHKTSNLINLPNGYYGIIIKPGHYLELDYKWLKGHIIYKERISGTEVFLNLTVGEHIEYDSEEQDTILKEAIVLWIKPVEFKFSYIKSQ